MNQQRPVATDRLGSFYRVCNQQFWAARRRRAAQRDGSSIDEETSRLPAEVPLVIGGVLQGHRLGRPPCDPTRETTRPIDDGEACNDLDIGILRAAIGRRIVGEDVRRILHRSSVVDAVGPTWELVLVERLGDCVDRA